MGYRILALIENADECRQLSAAAASRGHEVVHMRTIAEAMNWLNSRDHMDVIVSSVHLQNESVFEFLKAVKQDPRHDWIQFVMLCTAPNELAQFLNDQIERAAYVLGADKYLMMPELDARRLLDEIEASLPGQPPQKEQDTARDNAAVPRPTEEIDEAITAYADEKSMLIRRQSHPDSIGSDTGPAV
jgi:CheY-like chemotaxis protein